MRILPLPNLDNSEIFLECVKGVSNAALRQRYMDAEDLIKIWAIKYSTNAQTAKLFKFAPHTGKRNEIAVQTLTKLECYKLYEQYFRGSTKSARRHYDSLLLSIPTQLCPYCGFGHIYTIDHYLPKAKYPQFSVTIPNLIPACRDCNEGCKNALYSVTEGEQPLHPYYDGGQFIKEQWLFAKVVETSPATVQFYVSCPHHWSDSAKTRTRHHFKSFSLKSRFAVEAGKELSGLSPSLARYHANDTPKKIRDRLHETLDVEIENHMNSWKTALYDALIKSNWYCNGGFKNK
ncbi:hypothetical protein EJD88_20360 [Pseudomonas sp. PB105]|uniref:HNH endonuclease n=1 Tax=unclassified Pseudomonas TaxID=196821 RepID=UPI00131E5536|nr:MULTISPECIES: HNH endonuclease [unclassified Pseudomonas]KAE9651046.1 hypothetical protein EJD88_20360 [Pseudomonas sp. PB105]MCM2363467.1 HNH endonuclease [Pseudomonas sp. SR18]MVW98294.1 hypothetical protein [Pseudomonas sp. PB100]